MIINVYTMQFCTNYVSMITYIHYVNIEYQPPYTIQRVYKSCLSWIFIFVKKLHIGIFCIAHFLVCPQPKGVFMFVCCVWGIHLY